MTLANQDIGTDPAAPRLVGADQPIGLTVPVPIGQVSSAEWRFLSGPPQDVLATLHLNKTSAAGDVTFEDQGGTATLVKVTISAAETASMGPGRHYHDLKVALTGPRAEFPATGIFKLTDSSDRLIP